MKIKNILLIVGLMASVLTAAAQEDSIVVSKPRFYNPKNVLLGVTGNLDIIDFSGFEQKFFKNEVEISVPENLYDGKKIAQALNSAGVGKQILDYLFQYNGQGLSEEMLRERAFKTAQTFDKELAEVGLIDKNTILKEDLLPILENNYIVLKTSEVKVKKEGKTKTINKWHVFKVDINQETWEQVYNCWDNMDLYNQIEVPIVHLTSGKCRDDLWGPKNYREICKQVPAFAIRGQIASHHPLAIGIGESVGLRDENRMYVYRTSLNKKGLPVSKKVCTVRVGEINADTAWVYTIAGGYASRKRGDVAVLKNGGAIGHAFTAHMMDGTYGFDYTSDFLLSNNKRGMAHYLTLSLGASAYADDWKKSFLYEKNDDAALLYSPIVANAGLGWGMGFTMFHCLEIVPNLQLQYEVLLFRVKERLTPGSAGGIGGMRPNSPSAENLPSYTAHSLRLPVGVKLNVNLFYPVQLQLGATYDVVALKLNSSETFGYKDAENLFLKPNGYSRSGLNFFVGFRFL